MKAMYFPSIIPRKLFFNYETTKFASYADHNPIKVVVPMLVSSTGACLQQKVSLSGIKHKGWKIK